MPPGCGGLIRQVATRPNPLLICYVIGFLILWYTSSAWWSWWFGKAYGARAFIEMSGMFMIGLAFYAQWAGAAPAGLRRTALGAIVACVALNVVLMTLFDLKIVNRPAPDQPESQVIAT
jgi:hypothetical protein